MYNWNQFRNFPKFKDMSAQEQARQYFLYQSNMMMEQSANAALAPAAAAAAAAGAGGGGRLPQPKGVDYGVQSTIFLTNNETNDGYLLFTMNYETDEIKKTDFGVLSTEFNAPSDSSYVKNFQNAGYAFPFLGQGDNSGITRWIFVDATGSILDTIDINVSTNPDLYYVENIAYTTRTGMINVYNRYENGIFAGVSFLWFNGVDKPMKYDTTGYVGVFRSSDFDYSDRKGNFLFQFDKPNGSDPKDVYLIGKKMTLVKSYLPYTPEDGYTDLTAYTVENGEVTALVFKKRSNIFLNVISVASDHTIIEDTDMSSYEYQNFDIYPYGSSSKFVLKFSSGIILSGLTYLQLNGTTKKVAKKDFIEKAGGIAYDNLTCYWPDNRVMLPESFWVFTFTSAGATIDYGQEFTNFEMHYISGDDDKWHTFQKASFWLQGNLIISGKGLYIRTDNGGSSSVYSLYLSGGKETYTEIAQKSWQSSNLEVYAFGVSSFFIRYKGEDGNSPYFKIFKEGKLIESPFSVHLSGDQVRFGMCVLRRSGDNKIYWYGEDAEKIEEVVREEGSFLPAGWLETEQNTYNNIHPGCNDPLGVIREDLSSGYYRYHLFSPSKTSVTDSTFIDGYNFNVVRKAYRFQMEWTVLNGSNPFVRLYTPEDGLVAEYATGLNWLFAPEIYGKRSYVVLTVQNYGGSEQPNIVRYVLIGKSGVKEIDLTGFNANPLFTPMCNDTKNF